MAGGIRKYTVQEAGNVGLGQAGSFFIDDNTNYTTSVLFVMDKLIMLEQLFTADGLKYKFQQHLIAE